MIIFQIYLCVQGAFPARARHGKQLIVDRQDGIYSYLYQWRMKAK